MIAGLIGASVATAIGLAVHTLVEDETFRVYTIQFKGADQASLIHLRHLADVQNGQHLFTVSPAAVARSVRRHPWVKDASARLELPSTLVVTVQEHQPVMLLALEAMWYVSADGAPFRRAESHDLDYPVLTGVDAELVDDHPHLASAIIGRALTVLRATETSALGGTSVVSEVRFHRRAGFTLVLRSGSELMLGFAEPGARLDRLTPMVQQGLDLHLPQRIDLSADHVAITTPLSDIAQR